MGSDATAAVLCAAASPAAAGGDPTLEAQE